MALSPQDSPLFDTDDSDSDGIVCPEVRKDNIFELSAKDALDLLSEYLQRLLHGTLKHPLTPPTSPPQTPEAVLEESGVSRLDSICASSPEDGSPARSIVSPPDSGSSHRLQHHALARKFFSKHPPPIPIDEYLERLHRFCPLSPASYLAVTCYINKLVMEHLIAVTPLNVHRLLLAGLRVASKALEDRSYPNSRFSKVGGISLRELGRLEVSFLFLTSFELKVDERTLSRQLLLLNQRDY